MSVITESSGIPIEVTPEKSEEINPPRRGLEVKRHFTLEGKDVYEDFPWRKVDVRIDGPDGPVFEQAGVEVPDAWSDTAATVVASKYFRGRLGEPGREGSVRRLVSRVVDSISSWALADGYLAGEESFTAFRGELAYLLLSQRLAFNSPVYFNVGVEERPQSSACFINSVEDSMDSILRLAATEARIFKYGGGAGANLSALRGSEEPLEGGGTASGPVSFMRGFDAFAGVIKSGGRTRRAAKMIVLDVDHPDILDFVRCKVTEEGKLRALEAAGYGAGGMDSDAYRTISYQNANNSVRIPDAFLRAVEEGGTWDLRNRRDGSVARTVDAREIWGEIVRAAHRVGDPGLLFADAVNSWHTCPSEGEILGSNPCGEFVFIPDSACNLASLNLRKFQRSDDGSLSVWDLVAAVEVALLAQEVLVDRSSYPTPEIERNARRLRPLGLGYANLGAFLMAAGLPYDSDEARWTAAGITSLLTAAAYRQSARIAGVKGAFEAYERNAASMRTVLERHRSAVNPYQAGSIESLARIVWNEALDIGEHIGYRNAQTTLLAPTGTTSLMLDCDTTGVEPDLALAKRKTLAGGGELVLLNRSVEPALARLGYREDHRIDILSYLKAHGTIEGAPFLRPEHLPVFDCALPSVEGGRAIGWRGHVRMLAALQPHLSGAISKTVNLPADATEVDVSEVFLTAANLGLKGIVVYRDGCRGVQPLRGGNGRAEGHSVEFAPPPEVRAAGREKLPAERRSLTHKFEIAGFEGYVTAGTYDDGRLGELFCLMSKEGSTVSGLLDAWATAVSIALQYGVPFESLAEKFRSLRFEPAGFTGNPEIPSATSPIDYVVRWLELRFPGGRLAAEPPRTVRATVENLDAIGPVLARRDFGPPCAVCGSITEPSGTCFRCPTCGTTTGCS